LLVNKELSLRVQAVLVKQLRERLGALLERKIESIIVAHKSRPLHSACPKRKTFKKTYNLQEIVRCSRNCETFKKLKLHEIIRLQAVLVKQLRERLEALLERKIDAPNAPLSELDQRVVRAPPQIVDILLAECEAVDFLQLGDCEL
jgi:hypothetical protein